MLYLVFIIGLMTSTMEGNQIVQGTSQIASALSETSQSAGRRAGGQSASNTALVLAELRGLNEVHVLQFFVEAHYDGGQTVRDSLWPLSV